jgi:hypothetical protein
MINDAGESKWAAFDGLHYYLISQTFCASAAPRVRVLRVGARERKCRCVLSWYSARSVSRQLGIMNSSHSSCSRRTTPSATGLLICCSFCYAALESCHATRASYLISAANLISMPLAPRGRRERHGNSREFHKLLFAEGN